MSSSGYPNTIYLYGNCQLKTIATYLKNIPFVIERFPRIEYFYILDPIQKLDKALLAQTSVFIFQHTTARALVGLNETEKEKATSDYITQHILPESCQCISIPSVYSSILFPNCMSTREARVGFPESVPDEVFPNYTFSRRLHKLLLDRKSVSSIVKEMCDENAYLIADLEKNEIQNYENLRKREIENKVTIPLSSFIRSHFRKERLMLTTNHPTRIFFHYVLNEILKLMSLPPSDIALELPDTMIEYGKAPILPSVLKHLQLDTSHISFKEDEIWVFKQRFETYEDYVRYLTNLMHPPTLTE